MNVSYAVQDLESLFVQVVVKYPSVYSTKAPGIENWEKHVVNLRNYRASGNAARDTTLVFSVEPSDGDGRIEGPLEKLTLADIFEVLGNTQGRFDGVKFVNVHGRWDHRLNTLLNFLLFRTKELHLFDLRTEDHIPALHSLSFDERCRIEKLLIYENKGTTKEKTAMLFHAIAQMVELRFLQIDGKYPMEFSNQMCAELALRLRLLRKLEQFNIINRAFDTLGNDSFFSELLFIVATEARVRTVVAMSERNTNESIHHHPDVECRYLNFSSLSDMTRHKHANRLRALHFRHVRICPNLREDTKQAKHIDFLDLQHAFHLNQAGSHNARGDQSLIEFTQAQVLRLFPNLRVLRLNYCRVQTVHHLTWYLEKDGSRLEELLLEHNQIGRGQFLDLMKALPRNKTLRLLSLLDNPFEHNLTAEDLSVYHLSLLQSSLFNFPLKGGKDHDEWKGIYRRLTPCLCFNQINWILDQVRSPLDKQVPTNLWAHLLHRITKMGTFTQTPGVNWPCDVPYESSRRYFNSMAFFASSKPSIHIDSINVVFYLLRNELGLMQALGGLPEVVQQDAPLTPNRNRHGPFDDVMRDIDEHNARQLEEIGQGNQLEEAIHIEDFKERLLEN